MENITHENQRYYIWVCWKNGKGTDDIHNKLVIAEGTKALSKCTIYRWIEAFEAGQSNIKDTLHFERPREADTFSNVNIVEDLINNDPHTSIENVQGVITISIEKYKTTLHYEPNNALTLRRRESVNRTLKQYDNSLIDLNNC